MNAEKYVLKMTMHFGFVKETVSKGTIIEADRANKTMILSDGRTFKDLRDLDVCLKTGYVLPYSEQVVADVAKTEDLSAYKKSEPKKKDSKMPIVRSDVDNMQDQIDIGWTKNKKADNVKKGSLEVIRESTTEKIRGIPVVRASVEVVEGMNVGKDVELVASAKAQQKPVAPVASAPVEDKPKIGRPAGSKNKPKETPEEVAKKLADRKAQIEANRQKQAAEEKV